MAKKGSCPEAATISNKVIDKILASLPRTKFRWKANVIRDVVAFALEDLLRYAQKRQLTSAEWQYITKLADHILAYDEKSKGLFHHVYMPPPVLTSDWIRYLHSWRADIGPKPERGRPKQTWEPRLFAVGLGLFQSICEERPTIAGGDGQRPGAAMVFMMELIARGEEVAKERGFQLSPWRYRTEDAVKKQIAGRLAFEKDSEPSTATFVPSSYAAWARRLEDMLTKHVPIPCNVKRVDRRQGK